MPTQAEAASQSLLALLFIGIPVCGVRSGLDILILSPTVSLRRRRFRSALPNLLIYSSLAQSVEHAAVNRRVVGSSPTGGALFPILKKRPFGRFFFFLIRIIRLKQHTYLQPWFTCYAKFWQ